MTTGRINQVAISSYTSARVVLPWMKGRVNPPTIGIVKINQVLVLSCTGTASRRLSLEVTDRDQEEGPAPSIAY